MNEERFENFRTGKFVTYLSRVSLRAMKCVNGLHAIEHGERNSFTFRRLRASMCRLPRSSCQPRPYTLELEGSSPTT